MWGFNLLGVSSCAKQLFWNPLKKKQMGPEWARELDREIQETLCNGAHVLTAVHMALDIVMTCTQALQGSVTPV